MSLYKCESSSSTGPIINKNLGRLNSNQLDEIELRLLIGIQFKKLRELFGARKRNKEFEDYLKEQIDTAATTYRYYIHYYELLTKYQLFQHIPHWFREIRNKIGAILNWLDSKEASTLQVDNYLSQSYWKRCPASWLILPTSNFSSQPRAISAKAQVVSAETTFQKPQENNSKYNTNLSETESPGSTDSSQNRSMCSNSITDTEHRPLQIEQVDNWMETTSTRFYST